MFRHVVLFRLTESADSHVREEILNGLALLPTQIPSIKRFVFGRDVGIASGNFDIAVIADFADQAAYLEYSTHSAHVEFVRKCVRPYLQERSAVQFEAT